MELSRRALLSGLLATPLLPGAGRTSKMKFGLTTYQWGMDWDIPTIIANCTKARALGVELREKSKYAHGIELETPEPRCREVKKQFADSPVKLIGIATGERFDLTDPAALKAAIEDAKRYARLSHNLGASGIRVFPNDFHKEVPEEKTIAQIAAALNEVGKYAAEWNQQVRLENHGSAGKLVTVAKILEQVTQPNVRVKLNSDTRDSEGAAFARNFALVKDRLGYTLHCHDLLDTAFPYQLQADLLIDTKWDGWWLLEETKKVPDRVAALAEQRQAWEGFVTKSLQR